MRVARALFVSSCFAFPTIVWAAVMLAAGCSDSPTSSPVCIDAGIANDCTPPYEPTFDAVYANTFRPTCAKSGVSCHAATGKQGGINFDDPEAAYAALAK